MSLTVKTYENPILRVHAEPVTAEMQFDIDGKLVDLPELIQLMYETMEENKGIGLAASQIGLSYALFVINVEISEGQYFKCTFINPKIIDKYGAIYSMEEGCLSVPGIHQSVNRFGSILIHYYDENWKKQHLFFHGIQSRVIQHEYDHLQGILFTDYNEKL